MSQSLVKCIVHARALLLSLLTLCAAGAQLQAQESETPPATATDVFADDNLVAWCIVPFDAKQRGPAERAEMLQRLGLKHVAYDWRAQHVAEFEEEIIQYQKHNLNYFAFWSWHDAMEPLIKKHGIHPQIWLMMHNSTKDTQAERVADAAQRLLPLVEKTGSLGCKLGIYNHGGWAGEPENMIAVCRYLRQHHNADHVGIVYNFHHGHGHINDFAAQFKAMQPYLHCLNINGMDDEDIVASGRNKILPVGSGKHELEMLKAVRASGYKGPVGILDHRNELDAEESLKQNLDGLRELRKQLPAAGKAPSVSAAPGSIPDKLVVLTFDDSAKSHFTVVRPILKDYGFNATFFITEGWDFAENKQDYMTWEQIAQLHREGFDIGNHTRDHMGVTEKTVGRLDEQLAGIEIQCDRHGIPRPITFAWPGNATTHEAFEVLRAHGIRFARRGGSPEFPYEGGRGVAFEPGKHNELLLPSAGDARPDWNPQNFIQAVTQAKDGRVAILQFHGVPDTAHSWVSSSEDNFRLYMKYLDLNDYTVISLRDLQRYLPEAAVAD
jgi:sugar phosphate isomerase/epimerase